MACTRMTVDAPPAQVFATLADGQRYGDWVVGAKHIRAVEGEFPEPGAKIHHTVGAGPLEVKDSTKVEAVEPGEYVRLEARVRPFGVARVELRLEVNPSGGTTVSMEERIVEPGWLRALNPLMTPLIHARNAESLRRLKALVERAGRTSA